MSIEKLIEANTAALVALTAALTAAGTVSAASTGTASTGDTASTDKPASTGKGAAGKGKGAAAAPKGPTVEEMQAAVNEVKEKFGTAEAKAIIEGAGGVKKMAEIPEAKYKAVFDAAKAKLEEGDDDTGSDDDI